MPSQSFPSAEPRLSPLVVSVPAVPAPAGRRPRPAALRAAAGFVAGFASFVVANLDPWGGNTPWYLRFGSHVDLTRVSGQLLLLAVMWFVLPLVAYRRRDLWMVLVPIYGVWVVGLAFSRLVSLPYRDWRPRDDERPRLARIQGSSRYYVLGVD